MKSALASTGTMDPTRVLVRRGVITTAAMVLTVVIITLSATSALASNVATLLAVPPGQLATRQILQGRQTFQRRDHTARIINPQVIQLEDHAVYAEVVPA